MCWNAQISLCTFIFALAASIISLVSGYGHWRQFVFLMSFASMQLLEFFIWTYIGNASVNRILSALGLALIMLQPIAAGFYINGARNALIYSAMYTVFLIFFFAYHAPFDFSTVVNSNGHLQWNWLNTSAIVTILWTAFVLSAIWMSCKTTVNKLLIITLIVSMTVVSWWNFKSSGTWGTVYCSFVNIAFLFIMIKVFYRLYTETPPVGGSGCFFVKASPHPP